MHNHYDLTAGVLMCYTHVLASVPIKLSYSTQWEQYLTKEIVDGMVYGWSSLLLIVVQQRWYRKLATFNIVIFNIGGGTPLQLK